MVQGKDDNNEKGPDGFTLEQRRQILEMLESRKTAIIVYTWIGKTAKWIVTVGAALALIKATTSGYFKGIGQ